MSAGMGLWLGLHSLVTGVEDGPGGTTKVYIGARYNGVYVLVADPGDQNIVRRAWGSGAHHVTTPNPPSDALLNDDDPAAPGSVASGWTHRDQPR